MKRNNSLISVLLIVGIILLANVISRQFFFRWDLSADKQFTLSKATKDILKNLDDPVMVSAYFSENMPPDIEKTRRDFQELLVEFSNLSKGMVDYEFMNPNESEDKEREAQEAGIGPVMINVREKDQMTNKRAYLGAILKMNDQKEILPLIQPGTAMEYALSTSIKKMSVKDKPSVGIVQGYGAASDQELAQVIQSLSILYNVENLDLATETTIADRFRAVALVAPKDSIPLGHLAKLDDYLTRGGDLFIGINAVAGDFQTAQGSALTTGLEGWLRQKGIDVQNTFIVDANCGAVQVQQRVGPFSMPTQVSFPYFPKILNFPEHPITDGLQEVTFVFASPIRFVGDSLVRFTPIATSSNKSGTLTAPIFFDIQKKWTNTELSSPAQTVGGILEGQIAGTANARIVVFSDGDFPAQGQGGGQNPDNVNLMVNSIDWLSDDTGLIELRTKGTVSRPIEEMEDSERNFYKYLNFFLPIILIILYGFYRMQRKRNVRMRRMQERYS